MKKIKLNIFGTNSKDMVFYIYRSKNKELPNELETFINELTPVGIIDEKRDKSIEKTFKNQKANFTKCPKGYEGYNAFTFDNEFLYNGKVVTIHFKNDFSPAPSSNYIEIFIGNGYINKIKIYTYNTETKQFDVNLVIDKEIINEMFKIKDRYCLLINESITEYNNITFDYTINVYEFIDDGTFMDVECKTSYAHGVHDANLKFIDAKDDIIFYQDTEKHKSIYYYKIIGKSASGFITELSKQKVISISQSPQSISFILESTEEYKGDETVWKIESSDKDITENILIKKKKDLIANHKVQILKHDDVQADDKLLYEQCVRYLNVTNIWHKYNKRFNYRPKKIFRAKNKLDTIESPYTEMVFIPGDVEVLIDKIMILKKDVTKLPKKDMETPILIGDKDAETLKIYVRQNGIYYKDFFIGEFETNKDISTPNLVTAITDDSPMPVLSIKDDCMYLKKYNYTFYLYDELGYVSEPCSFVF